MKFIFSWREVRTGFRRLLFWAHLAAGATAGLVILALSVTGALLAYEHQIVAWADSRFVTARPIDRAAPLALEAMLRRLKDGPLHDAAISSLSLRVDPAAPLAVGVGRERTIFIDPGTGEVLGEGSQTVRAFFRAVTDWHRFLGASGEWRASGRAVTGAANLAFLGLLASGLYLWWPAGWTRRHLAPIAGFQPGLSGRARDFNWHNAIGIWCWLPLMLVVGTAVVMSYGWANDLLYRVAGSEPPATRPAPERGAARNGRPTAQPNEIPITGLDAAWKTAVAHQAGWQTITLRAPAAPAAPLVFVIDAAGGTRPDRRTQLSVDRKTSAVLAAEPFESLSLGRRLRTWVRWVHTGEAAGVVGQTIAALASIGAVVLVWTGFALAWHRLGAWRVRRRSRQVAAISPAPTPVADGPGNTWRQEQA